MVEHNHNDEIKELYLIAEAVDEDELDTGGSSEDLDNLVKLLDALKEASIMKWAGSELTVAVEDEYQYEGEDADIEGESVTFTVWTEESFNEIVIDESSVGEGSETAVLDSQTLTITLDDDNTDYSADDIVAIVKAEEEDIHDIEITERDAVDSGEWLGTTSMDNVGIEGAFVTVRDSDKNIAESGTTDEEGEVEIDDLPKGTYEVKASKEGYETNDEEKEIDTDSSEETQTVTLTPDWANEEE